MATLVSRARCSVKLPPCRTGTHLERFLLWQVPAQRCSARALHRVRDTRDEAAATHFSFSPITRTSPSGICR